MEKFLGSTRTMDRRQKEDPGFTNRTLIPIRVGGKGELDSHSFSVQWSLNGLFRGADRRSWREYMEVPSTTTRLLSF